MNMPLASRANSIINQRADRYRSITPTITGQQWLSHRVGFGIRTRVNLHKWFSGLTILTDLCLQNQAGTVIDLLALFKPPRAKLHTYQANLLRLYSLNIATAGRIKRAQQLRVAIRGVRPKRR